MVLDAAAVAGGLLLLLGGGESLVRGASGIARTCRVHPAVVALTIVAAGTSMPELVVSVLSALQGSPGLAVGNVVGSNLFNILLIVGLTALVRPLRIQGSTVRREWPVMMLAAFQLHLLVRDGTLDRLEGTFLLAGLIAFTAYAVAVGRSAAEEEPADAFELEPAVRPPVDTARALRLDVGWVALGVGCLAGGSTLLVNGAVGIASALGVSETTIGLTIVAAGTSAPELVTSLVAAWRGKDDIAVGNVVGSNIFNVLGIAGTTAALSPISVPEVIVARDNLVMLAASLLLFPLMWTGMRVNRIEGGILFAGFVAYMALLLG